MFRSNLPHRLYLFEQNKMTQVSLYKRIKNFIDPVTVEKSCPPSLYEDEFFNELRKREYSSLDKNGHIYLDYGRGGLYAKTQIDQHRNLLVDNVFTNPHLSNNQASKQTLTEIEETRTKVLEYFNAKDYHCFFIKNVSNALQLVEEFYYSAKDVHYLLLADNQYSIPDEQEWKLKFQSVSFATLDENFKIDRENLLRKLDCQKNKKRKLFYYPAQSSFSGVKHSLKWVEIAQQKGWNVILDIDSYTATNSIDLSTCKPQFTCFSFNKMFGYPADIGCLLIRKDIFQSFQTKRFLKYNTRLKQPYHSYLCNDENYFEDDTIDHLSIPAIKFGLDHLKSIDMLNIRSRVKSLMDYLIFHLNNCKHSNGKPILKILGPEDRSFCGPSVAMTYLKPNGTYICLGDIEKRSYQNNIFLNSGFFNSISNIASMNIVFEKPTNLYISRKENEAGDKTNQNFEELSNAAVISLGIATNKADLDAYIEFAKSMKDFSFTVPKKLQLTFRNSHRDIRRQTAL